MSRPDELHIAYVPLDDLVPYERNSKKHPPEQIEQIAASIREFGDCDPIAVWHDADGRPIIVEGHGRLLALQLLGADVAPVISLDHLTDEQRRAYSHVHNQTTLSSGFDEEMLALDMDELAFDWEEFGFEVPASADPEDAPEVEVPEDPVTRVNAGEVWRMGDHVLLCADATDPSIVEAIRGLAGGGSVDLLLTDPPYNVAYDRQGECIANDSFAEDEAYVVFLSSAIANAREVMRPGAPFYIWHAIMQTANVRGAIEHAGLDVRQYLIWAKNTFAIGRQDYQWRHEPCAYGWKEGAAHSWYGGFDKSTIIHDLERDPKTLKKDELVEIINRMRVLPSTVLEFAKPTRSPEHPTMKPTALFARLIANSTKPGDIVLDPFAGSGTTALAAEHQGRRSILVELEPSYCDVILARWEEMTGRTAQRIDGSDH